jgi:hypothetical protein
VTDEDRCKYAGTGSPRILPGRHADDCPGDACEGCQPCDRSHCPVCGVRHSATTCPECLGAVREDLDWIAANARSEIGKPDRLLTEAAQGGADQRLAAAAPIPGADAMVMLAPGNLHGRTDESWSDPVPPLLVLATWEDDWRIQFRHGGGPRATVARCADYLDRNLDRAAREHPAFEDFAADLRRLRARLERVIHDQPHGDRANVPCFDCGGDLERKLTGDGFDDAWTCRRCKRRYTDPEYHLAVRAKIEAATG